MVDVRRYCANRREKSPRRGTCFERHTVEKSKKIRGSREISETRYAAFAAVRTLRYHYSVWQFTISIILWTATHVLVKKKTIFFLRPTSLVFFFPIRLYFFLLQGAVAAAANRSDNKRLPRK